MRVDFYHLTRDPAERVVPALAAAVLKSGARLLVATQDAELRKRISDALWAGPPESFLAHGEADAVHTDRQPILLSAIFAAPNQASMVLIADGKWDDAALGFARVLFLFDDTSIESARSQWAALRSRDDLERHYWKQDGGKWREAG